MDYLEHEKEYFKNFVPEEYENIDHYISHKRKNGIWGDNIEIQILGELYSSKIEIYAYANKPFLVTGAVAQDDRVIRLSYHQNSHYNSIVGKNHTNEKDWKISDTLGHLEDIAFAHL